MTFNSHIYSTISSQNFKPPIYFFCDNRKIFKLVRVRITAHFQSSLPLLKLNRRWNLNPFLVLSGLSSLFSSTKLSALLAS